MNCEHVENLLPAYTDGDLPDDDKSRIDAHLEGCESCRESLAFFTHLETSLTERRELRPSDSIAAGRIARRITPRKERVFLHALTGMPALVSAALIAIGIVWLLARAPIQKFFSNVGNLQIEGFGATLSTVLAMWTSGIDPAAVGNEWTWAIAYLGVVALILTTGSWMVLRYVRH
jgi:predicted anti-sigma-YlaC factor YlaD